MYLCKFDASGKRTATVVDGIHYATTAEKQQYLDDGYIETSDDDYAYYVGNRGTGANGTSYVRGADGKPIDAPAVVVSDDEKKAAALAELDSHYTSDKNELSAQYLDAAMAEDTDTMNAIKDELAALNEKYDADYAALDK